MQRMLTTHKELKRVQGCVIQAPSRRETLMVQSLQLPAKR